MLAPKIGVPHDAMSIMRCVDAPTNTQPALIFIYHRAPINCIINIQSVQVRFHNATLAKDGRKCRAVRRNITRR